MEENENGEDQVEESSQVIRTQDKDSRATLLFIGLIILAGAVAIGGYLFYRGSQQKQGAATVTGEPVQEEAIEETEQELLVEKNAINVSSAQAGDELTVSYALLENPGFIVIHEDEEGKPGSIVGTSDLLLAGENRDVAISLDEELVEDGIYYAMLHADDGDEEFDAMLDAPVQSLLGNPIMMMFVVTGEIEESTQSGDVTL